ncbi:MAG: winged helix DNA-binding domain-containing protein [Thermoleophilia bacterium]
MNAAALLQSQGLGAVRARDPHTAVRTAFAIQAQDVKGARLGVRARSEGLAAADVARACGASERSLVRTWAMRSTLHMLPAEDVRWVVGLLGPLIARRGARRRAELGLDDRACARILDALPAVLAGGPLTRAEVVAGLAARGARIDPDGQAPAHALLLAAAEGLVCRGPDGPRDAATYVLLDDWVAPEPARDRDAALAELARRHRAAYGPGDAGDLARWSGLPAADARRAWALAGPPPPAPLTGDGPPPPRLLPAFDGALLGHRDRDPLLPPDVAVQVVAGPWIHPAVVAGGRVIGAWRRDDGTVRVRPIGALPRGTRAGLRAEAEDVGRFLGVPTRLEVAA